MPIRTDRRNVIEHTILFILAAIVYAAGLWRGGVLSTLRDRSRPWPE
jgi:hypothetical protein